MVLLLVGVGMFGSFCLWRKGRIGGFPVWPQVFVVSMRFRMECAWVWSVEGCMLVVARGMFVEDQNQKQQHRGFQRGPPP